MANYSIEDVEMIRKKSGLTYQEAVALLDYHNGNVTRAMIDLERNGKIRQDDGTVRSGDTDSSKDETFGRKVLNTIQKLYRFRIKISKEDTPVLNFSLAFCILSLVFAPYLSIAGVVLSLILGYRFSFDTKDPAFAGVNLEKTVRNAAQNAKSSVNSVVQSFSGEKNNAPEKEDEAETKPEESYFNPNPASASRNAYSAYAADVPTIQVPVRTETSEGNVVVEDEGNGYHSATIG
ncbi:MAG: DUF4342 domain-containing protein [Clostridia bacterium]|nr:DUF4342 domain-containing protein [Clostridia bacterium]